MTINLPLGWFYLNGEMINAANIVRIKPLAGSGVELVFTDRGGHMTRDHTLAQIEALIIDSFRERRIGKGSSREVETDITEEEIRGTYTTDKYKDPYPSLIISQRFYDRLIEKSRTLTKVEAYCHARLASRGDLCCSHVKDIMTIIRG